MGRPRIKDRRPRIMKKIPRPPVPFNLTPADIVRFKKFVIPGNTDDCWEWKGGCNPGGYGNFKVANVTKASHRVSFQIANGPPKGYVCHTCDNKKCCNPSHLYDGDNVQNMRDCDERNRPRGVLNGRAKLSEQQVSAIATLKRKGIGITDVAKQLGIPVKRVSNPYYGYSWSHLTGIEV